jgi:hypothetical protein
MKNGYEYRQIDMFRVRLQNEIYFGSLRIVFSVIIMRAQNIITLVQDMNLHIVLVLPTGEARLESSL